MLTRIILTFLGAVFCQAVFAQTNNYYPEFKTALSKSDTVAMHKILQAWRKQTTNDPEQYVAFTNYYFVKGRQEILNMSTARSGDKSIVLTDPKSGKVAGYINEGVSYNPIYMNKAVAYIDSGLAKYPNRLDLRFGKVYLYGQIKDYDLFTGEIVKTIDYGQQINNKWLWSENKQPAENPVSFMLGSVQDYVRQLFNAGDEQIDNMKQIAQTVLKYYPNDVPSLSNVSIACMIKKDYDNALNALFRAAKLDSKDIVVLNNIAYCYRLKNDKPNAIKYYQQVIKYGNDDAKKDAEGRIKELQK